MRRAKLRKVVLVVAVILLVLWISGQFVAAYVAGRPDVDDAGAALPERAGPQWSTQTFGGENEAWFASGAAENPALLMVHGYGSSRTGLFDLANDFNASGYTVMLIELPYATSGAWNGGNDEAEEINTAAAWLEGRGHEDIAGVGFSAGGYATLLAGTEDDLLDAVVTDGAFVDARTTLWEGAEDRTDVPSVFFAGMPFAFTVVNRGRLVDLRDERWLDADALIIHGGQDDVVSVSNQRALVHFTEGEAWTDPAAGHVVARTVSHQTYIARVDRFLKATNTLN